MTPPSAGDGKRLQPLPAGHPDASGLTIAAAFRPGCAGPSLIACAAIIARIGRPGAILYLDPPHDGSGDGKGERLFSRCRSPPVSAEFAKESRSRHYSSLGAIGALTIFARKSRGIGDTS